MPRRSPRGWRCIVRRWIFIAARCWRSRAGPSRRFTWFFSTREAFGRMEREPMNDQPIRLVAVDLDGTLLNDSKQISERTIDALKCLPQRGVKVVIASARPPRSVRPIYRELGLDTWQINYNGALIWDEPSQQPVFHRPMHPRLVRMMIERCRDMFEEVLVSCEVLDKWFTDRDEHTYTT